MTATTADLIANESTHARTRVAVGGRGRLMLAAGVVVVVWSAYAVGIGRRALVNGAGWSQVGEFFAAAAHPDFAPEVIRAGWNGALITVAYAVLGTVGSTLVGLPLGIVAATGWRSAGRRLVLPRIVRAALIPARGSHEIIWALLLLNILGLNPLVAVLAISLPFGAVTAKVVSQLLDDTPSATATAVRGTGASSVVVLAVGIFPLVRRDIASYLSYRFECALRAAAVLGVAGAGGLGTELRLSFQSLRYGQMWTFLFVLILLGGIADAISARLRRPARSAHHRRSDVRVTAALTVVAVVLSWRHLGLAPSTLWSARSRRLASEVAGSWFPPDVTGAHLRLLGRLATQTLAISVFSSVTAFLIATPLAFLAARPRRTGPARRFVGWAARFGLLVCRAIPPSVWAFVVVLVLFPGPLPAAVALAVYNTGVLGRLLAESVENLPTPTIDALAATGARPLQVFAVGVVPLVGRRFLTYGLYRWEVALRETIVVGIVAAGGLGQHIGTRLAAFDYPQVTAAVAAMVALTVVVDITSAGLRRHVAST